ncbi:prolyl oligopeptidase family serine peptidase [Rudanella paleaurantiibacter]|uniref:Prolyl oligopeptidase family serine peptidase n=1 Tax=Rudanella paleaurantiibacter TaxID=2614655 RepID=A0A7J5U5A0_9BACT|nr:S9 family peptidase [Rudanella paleaurantiibacter]KAB7732255.1 prolyl oligopeptidase family serine peptidase [Rudanella paleaurantiibacter]
MRFRFLFLLLFPAVVFAQKQKIVATDLTRIKQVGGITLSPDGNRAIYTLTTIEPTAEQAADARTGDYEYRTHIYLTNLKAGDAKALTRGTESARQPSWSPDGSRLAFVRTVKGKSQVFVMPLDGGEAYQLTDSKYGANNPSWSPNGKQILFEAGVSFAEMLNDTLLNPGLRTPSWSLEKPGFANNDFVKPNKTIKANPDGSLAEIRAYLQKDVDDKKAKVITRLNFQGEATTEPDMSFTHLYLVDVREGAPAERTPARPITRGFYSFNSAGWFPNGQQIVAVTKRDTLKHPDREQANAIVVIAADGKSRPTVLMGQEGRSYFSPELSPDGTQMAFLSSPTEGVNVGQMGLATLNGTTVSGTQLIPFDRSAGNFSWATLPVVTRGRRATTTATALYFTAPSNGGFPLYRLNPTTKEITQLTPFEKGVSSFDAAPGRVVMALTEVANPSELVMADADAKNPVVLTGHNAWVEQKALSFPEKRVYTNSKGQAVDYWIMKPTAIASGSTGDTKKYPLLLNMHGGPSAMWGPGEGSMWHEFQYMCAQGYGVVYANPRGSGGYGEAFLRGNVKDWGTGPAEDVLAAATAAAKEPWVDTERQVITGGSYAGYLTAWIVAHDNRFKAAFAQRGVYDLTTFMGEGNAWRLVPNYFGGYPWQPETQKILDANSPYSFVENIRTPLLIKHGENDLRTGVIQSEMMMKSLKVLGRPVEYVRMPGGTHELSRSGNVRQRIDRILRIYEFFERYVGEPTGTVK